MKLQLQKIFFLLTVIAFLFIHADAYGAGRASIGISGGTGFPLDWWGERWDPLLISEINLHYEFSPGVGLLLFTDFGKAQFTELSTQEILEESRLRNLPPEFEPYASTVYASQAGSFRQIPIGFGFFMERPIGGSRRLSGYGSFAMAVHLWKFERSQDLIREVDPPNLPSGSWEDNWTDEVDGSNVGAQLGLGVLYQMRRNLFFDVSVAYHFVDIGQKNGALAYWGQPARLWDDQKIEEADSRVDFIQLRMGFRFGI